MRTFNRNRIYKHPPSRHSVLNNSGSRLLPLPPANQRRILHHHRERWIPTLLQPACIPLASLSQTPDPPNLRSQSTRRMFQRGVWRCVAVMQLVEASVRVSKNILLINDIETTTRPSPRVFLSRRAPGASNHTIGTRACTLALYAMFDDGGYNPCPEKCDSNLVC